MPVSTRLTLMLVSTQTIQADGGPKTNTHSPGVQDILWRSGVGYNEADLVFSDTRSLAASSNEDLDLVGGFTDGLGNTVSPAKIKALIIENLNTDDQVLTIKAAASNGWAGFISTSGIYLGPGSSQCPGIYAQVAPKGRSITGGTGDLLNVANASGNTCSYRITVVATSS